MENGSGKEGKDSNPIQKARIYADTRWVRCGDVW